MYCVLNNKCCLVKVLVSSPWMDIAQRGLNLWSFIRHYPHVFALCLPDVPGPPCPYLHTAIDQRLGVLAGGYTLLMITSYNNCTWHTAFIHHLSYVHCNCCSETLWTQPNYITSCVCLHSGTFITSQTHAHTHTHMQTWIHTNTACTHEYTYTQFALMMLLKCQQSFLILSGYMQRTLFY